MPLDLQNQSVNASSIRSVVLLIGFVLLFAATFLALMRLDTFLKYQALDKCSKVARLDKEEESQKVSYPIVEFYDKCIERIGLK